MHKYVSHFHYTLPELWGSWERLDVNKWNVIKDKSITWHSVSNVRSYESVCQSSHPSWEKDVNISENIMCEHLHKNWEWIREALNRNIFNNQLFPFFKVVFKMGCVRPDRQPPLRKDF